MRFKIVYVVMITIFVMCVHTPSNAFEVSLRNTLNCSDSKITYVIFSPDGALLASVGDGLIFIWDTKTARKLCKIWVGRERSTPNGYSNHLYKVVFSPNSRLIVTATGWLSGPVPTEGLSDLDLAGLNKGKVQLWDSQTGRLLHTLKLLNSDATNDFEDVSFSPDGKTIAVVGGGKLDLWDTESGKFQQSITAGVYMRSVKFSPDGRFLLGGGDHTEWALWDAHTGKIIRKLEDAKSAYGVRFSRDGKEIRAMCWVNKKSYYYVPTFWSTQTGKITRTFPGPVYQTIFSPDEKRIVGQSDKAHDYSLLLYNGENGTAIRTLVSNEKGTWFPLSFSSDSKLLAVITGFGGAKQKILFFDARTGEPLRFKTAMNVGIAMSSIAFSPVSGSNGSLLAVINNAGKTIRLWNIKP